jgi:hypothetical protein
MPQMLNAPEDELKTMASLSGQGVAVPASLKAEYEELFLKREELRAKLEGARAELAALKAKAV